MHHTMLKYWTDYSNLAILNKSECFQRHSPNWFQEISEHIYNADQTAIFSDIIPSKTIDTKGTRTVWVRTTGLEKMRLTVVLLGCSDGSQVHPFVVWKNPISKKETIQIAKEDFRNGFGTRLFKEIEQIMNQQNIQIHTNSKG